MTKNPFMREDDSPLSLKMKFILWGATALGVILLGIASFFITKQLTSTEPLVAEESDRLIEDDYEKEAEAQIKELVKPGTVIEKEKTGTSSLGKDFKTNYPILGEVGVDSIREVDPTNIGPLKLEQPLLGDYEARIWYVSASITTKDKPSADTPIHFPLALSNDATPGDDTKGMVFSRTNPDCPYGPETWGQVDGNTATLCRVLITFNNEPIDKVFLVMTGLDYETHPEYASNPPTFKFTANPIAE